MKFALGESMVSVHAVIACLLLLAALVYLYTVPGRRSKGLPPGPPTWPIVGNLLQIPPFKMYVRFAEWAKEYGEIYSLKTGPSQTTVVISSRRLVKEIMDKKSVVSSGRPRVYALDTLVYKGDFLLTMNPENPRFRLGRKLIHQFYMESMVEKNLLPVMHAESAQLMKDLMQYPADFQAHAKRYTNSIIMCTLYGRRTPSMADSYLVQLTALGKMVQALAMPGSLPPVDLFPILRWVPERFLRNWRSRCIAVSKASDKLYGGLIREVVKRREAHGPKETYLDKLLDQQDELGLTHHELLYMTGVVLDAGTDTTATAFSTLVLMMAKYPDVLKAAQQEIDAVIPEDRLPLWEDFEKLPVVNQIIKEVQRFRTVVPIAFPHRLTEDIKVDGYHLPKNTSIIAHTTVLHHDEQKFANATEFDPGHYKGKTELASAYANAADYELRDHYGYGYGRRLCPGIHLAERSLFITYSRFLWAFDVRPALDDQGQPIPLDDDFVTGYTDGAVVHPKPFEVSIKVRSEPRRQAIADAYEMAEKDVFPQFRPLNDKV